MTKRDFDAKFHLETKEKTKDFIKMLKDEDRTWLQFELKEIMQLCLKRL